MLVVVGWSSRKWGEIFKKDAGFRYLSFRHRSYLRLTLGLRSSAFTVTKVDKDGRTATSGYEWRNHFFFYQAQGTPSKRAYDFNSTNMALSDTNAYFHALVDMGRYVGFHPRGVKPQDTRSQCS